MFRRLAAGEFGNTNPSFYSLDEWYSSSLYRRKDQLWGIRSIAGSGQLVVLDVPTWQVKPYVTAYLSNGFNLGPMVDPYALLRGYVWERPGGLELHGVIGHRDVKWREAMNTVGQVWNGLAAKVVLDRYLWPGDREDLRDLLALYPNHVVEFSACDRALGTVPHRNCVIWEVRIADGSYEKWM